MKKKFIIITIAIGFITFGYFILNSDKQEIGKDEHSEQKGYWTCSMHPQIKMDKSGKCPICNMNLIHVEQDEEFSIQEILEEKDKYICKDNPEVTSETESVCPIDGTDMIKINMEFSTGKIVAKLKLKELQVDHFKAELFSVQKMKMTKNLRVLGKVIQSENKESNIPAQVAGRVEKIYINSVGSFVAKGDPVVKLYSPELISIAEEYLIAKKGYVRNKTTEYRKLLLQVEKKLKLIGVEEFQYRKWYKNNNIPNNIIIYSSSSGIVKSKNAVVGKYFNRGASFYDLVNLSKVWVEMDVYEQDATLVKNNQAVEMSFVSYPGDTWSSNIDFISSLLSEQTRTLKIRATIDNKDGKLKPGMVGEGNIAIEFPEEVLVIPRSAVIDTGKRKVVWLSLDENRYIAKTIHTGFESEGFIEIKHGLKEDEKVVVEGNFLLDAQAQLFGGYNMDNTKQEEENIDPHQNH